jgi:hypothetical protein
MQNKLMDIPEEKRQQGVVKGKGQPRIQRANRQQIEMRMAPLDSLVPEDHKVRIVLEMAQEYDLIKLYEYIDAIEGEAGRPAIDPLILVALWLYATTEGVGSARELKIVCSLVSTEITIGNITINYLSRYKMHPTPASPDRLTPAGHRSARGCGGHLAEKVVFRITWLAKVRRQVSQTVETVEKVLSDSRKTSRFGILQASTESRGTYAALQSL